MCGITGFFTTSPGEIQNGRSPIEVINEMCSTIEHRGPDQNGVFCDQSHRLFLGHQRLSILDLSDTGSQPMTSHCGRFSLVFNGEIYNFQEIKDSLTRQKHMNWRGSSDTEVLLELIAEVGLAAALLKLNGMFAFALYDNLQDKLFLGRDRFGEKPLYAYSTGVEFAFGSELRAIEKFTDDLSINPNAVNAQLQFSYIPSPYSIYNEVFKVPSGSFIVVELGNYAPICAESATPFWSVGEVVEAGSISRKSKSSIAESLERVEDAITKSVKMRMIADVPVGLFLSGGIDSTCIAALAQSISSDPINTFSIGFDDHNYNEAHHALDISKMLGSQHHELYLNPKDMVEQVTNIPSMYDEPFADSSQLATFMVSKFAKKNVSVALTGDAGDEVFCGYNRYHWGAKINRNLNKIPVSVRGVVTKSISSISPSTYDRLAFIMSRVFPKLKKYKAIGDKAHKLSRVLDFRNEADLYKKLISTWPECVVKGEIHDIATDFLEAFKCQGLSLTEKMMWQDAVGYMQNDILTKVDRASMAVGLETRVPFLDNDVFQLAWSLPLEHKLYRGITKYPLRKIINKYLPSADMNRPKAGFGVPIASWFREELRDYSESLFSEDSLRASGLLDYEKIRKTWKSHLDGTGNYQYEIWNVLMFQQWYFQRYKSQKSGG